jgi:DMSO/TMAO reductase YedYZ molybdopterin-dependent catalytic subunit
VTNDQNISRRDLLKAGGSAFAGLAVLRVAGPSTAFGQAAGQVIPWLDQPPPNPVPQITGNLLKWEELDSWLTPAANFFYVNHYGLPRIDGATWRMAIGGLVARPRTLTLEDLRARERHEVDFTLECSGNNGDPGSFFTGGIGNARWAGARLGPLLNQAGILDEAAEVVFWGTDSGKVTIRDNTGIRSAGQTGQVDPDAGGGLDLTITEQFARSMSVREALRGDNLLCYQMNGEPLPPEHGFPVRLIAPGWYGVANVKWLSRIDVVSQRFAGQFMARDYVSIREQQRDGQSVWTFSTVKHTRLKSAPAKVTRSGNRYSIMGAAWGAPVAAVEVQIDAGPWMRATLDDPPPRRARGYSWRFWTFDWGMPAAGEHAVKSRAIDLDGNVQPAPEDASIATRRTFWENNAQITRRSHRLTRVPGKLRPLALRNLGFSCCEGASTTLRPSRSKRRAARSRWSLSKWSPPSS